MSEVTYRITFSPRPGALETQVDYRLQNGSWQTPVSPPNPTTLPYYDISLTRGQTYNIRLSSIGTHCAPRYKYLTIEVPLSGDCCAMGYTLSPDGTYCYKEESIPPTIVQGNICFAASQLASQYSSSGTFLYDPGYNDDLTTETHTLLTTSYWKEGAGTVTGPMNREGIWVDTDCNGVKDGLTAGQVLQITVPVVLPMPKTLYIGVGGDNTFRFDLNGTIIVDRDASFLGDNFNIWHLMPVDFPSGTTYVTFQAVGDGTTNDSFAAVIYDNVAADFASTTTDTDLNILFQTSSLIGGSLDIATCPSGYFLDTSGGQGNYVCKRVLTDAPFSC